MTNPYADRTISRALLQEIRQDRALMEEGHHFLDEMRVLLGQELLVHVERYGRAARRMESAHERARRALGQAVLAAGLHNLQAHPSASLEAAPPRVTFDNFLGVHLPRIAEAGSWPGREGPMERPGDSPEVRDVREAFASVIRESGEAALETAAIFRLYREYRHADRRARALENVLMPELRDAERRTDEALQAADLEEAVHIRLAGERSRRLRSRAAGG